MIGKGHGSNEVLPILVLANEFSNQCGVPYSVLDFSQHRFGSQKVA